MSETRDAQERPRLSLVTGLDPLTSDLGPFYEIDLPQTGWRAALLIAQRHLGSDGGAHQAVLSALADLVMRKVAIERVPDLNCSLVQMSLQIMAQARVERWLYAEAVVLSRSRGLLFTAGELFDDNGPVAMSSAVWKVGQPA